MSNSKVWLLAFSFSLLAFVPARANSLPTAGDINSLSEKANLVTNAFVQKSFELRMGYEYAGQFINPDDKNKLHKLAKKAGSQLQAIANTQRRLKQQIEDYQGRDWDAKYGSTGLWRKLSTDLYITNLNKCETDYYLALTVEQSPLNKTLQDVREQIVSLDTAQRSVNSQLLRAKILALAKIDSAWQALAMDILDSLMAQPNVTDAIYFRAAIERVKLINSGKLELLNSLAGKFAKSSCADDLELILSLTFLQRRLNQPEAFERTVNFFPQTQAFLGSLILSDMSRRLARGQLDKLALLRISIFEAELAAQAAWQNKAEDYKTLLDHLSGTEKFQTPLMLYVSAVAFAQSSPAKAVELLMEAGKFQKTRRSNRLEASAETIATQAAQLAYNLFIEDRRHCRLALTAFENYSAMAGKKIDEELEYLHTAVLNSCGYTGKAEKLLQKIVDRPTGNYRSRAKLDLIIRQIQQNQWKDKDSAQKLLDAFTEAEAARDQSLNVFKSKALRQLGRLDESARSLLKAIDPNRCEHTGESMELLAEIIDQIDQVQVQIDNFPEMIQDCKKLAEFCRACLNGQTPSLLLAEISIFAADKEHGKLSAVEKLLNSIVKDGLSGDIDFIRCKARLLTKQGKFSEAAGLWTQICKMRKNEMTSANQRSWKWWRAKFYELYCWDKMPQTPTKDILHTLEVLENTFIDIPPLWTKKLNSLKQQRRPPKSQTATL